MLFCPNIPVLKGFISWASAKEEKPSKELPRHRLACKPGNMGLS